MRIKMIVSEIADVLKTQFLKFVDWNILTRQTDLKLIFPFQMLIK